MTPIPPVFTDTNLATKANLLGEGPKCKNSKFTTMLKNSEASLELLIKAWTTEQLLNKNGTIRKRDVKDMPELAEYTALCTDLIKDLKALGCFSNETMARVCEDARQQQLGRT